jgi:hypothetical protein
MKIPYLNSEAYHATMNATTPEQLKNRRRYTVMAIEFHERENDPGQVEFFREELFLIDKRLAKMENGNAPK